MYINKDKTNKGKTADNYNFDIVKEIRKESNRSPLILLLKSSKVSKVSLCIYVI